MGALVQYNHRAWNSSWPLAIFRPICPIWLSKSDLLRQMYCTFPMGKRLIIYFSVPAFKEWLTNFKLLFQALHDWDNGTHRGRALHGRHKTEIHPSDRETSVNAIQACLGLWLALLGPIASPNGLNRRFDPPLVSHQPPPTSSPSRPPTPYNVLSVILLSFWKKLLIIQQY